MPWNLAATGEAITVEYSNGDHLIMAAKTLIGPAGSPELARPNAGRVLDRRRFPGGASLAGLGRPDHGRWLGHGGGGSSGE